MKRFKKATKCVVAALTLCFAMAFCITVQAASYAPGQIYVNPSENTKKQYYSVLKHRMKTYDEMDLNIVFPQDGAFSVKSSSKALKTEVTEQYYGYQYEDNKKVYVPATPAAEDIEVTYYYIGRGGDATEVSKDPATGAFYKSYGGVKVPVTPNKTRKEAYPGYTYQTPEGYNRTVTVYDDGDGKGWYYYDRDLYEYSQGGHEQDTPDGQPQYRYRTATVRLSSTKAGNYTVTIKAGSVSKKVKVYVTPNGGWLKTAKLGKSYIMRDLRTASDKKITKTYSTSYQVSSKMKSGKLKVTADKGVKVTGLIVMSVDKNGKMNYKKVKNGGKITLSQGYDSMNTNYTGYRHRSPYKKTYVLVSTKDSYTGTSVTYSIVTKHGYKQIKRAAKDASGKTIVTYMNYSYNICLWTY